MVENVELDTHPKANLDTISLCLLGLDISSLWSNPSSHLYSQETDDPLTEDHCFQSTDTQNHYINAHVNYFLFLDQTSHHLYQP